MVLQRKEVVMGQTLTGDQTSLLYTRTLMTCIGLTIHDQKQKLGVLSHIPGYDLGYLESVLSKTRENQSSGLLSDKLSGRLVLPYMTRDREALEYMDEVKGQIPELLTKYKDMADIELRVCQPEYGVGLLALLPVNGIIYQFEITNQEFLDRWGT